MPVLTEACVQQMQHLQPHVLHAMAQVSGRRCAKSWSQRRQLMVRELS
jgi:hypothetical protein